MLKNAIAALILLLASSDANAQQFVVARQDKVASGRVAEYETSAFPERATVIALSEERFLAMTPVSSLDEIAAAAHAPCACVESSTASIWKYRPDLSYQPAGLATDRGPYVHIDFFHVKPGTRSDAEALAKNHAEVDRSAGVAHPWDIYVAEDGYDLPVLIQVVRAKSRADYESERHAAEALRGDRIRPVYVAVSKILRKQETIDGRQICPVRSTTEGLSLPGANGLVTLDYLAFDRTSGRLWVPAGNTASVDVIDGSSIRRIAGFPVRAFELKGRRGFLGPSSVAIGPRSVYVGNRGDSTICAIDRSTLQRRRCIRVARSNDWGAAPDAVVYVAPTGELWITRGAPPLGIPSSDKAITVLDANTLRPKTKIALGASAEGYAVDESRGVFYTNLEESGETIAIDARTRTVAGRWRSGCAEPHGIAIDERRGFVFVACSDRVFTLDATHGGKVVASLATGAGLDNIDFDEQQGKLYAAASIDAVLTVARVADDGAWQDVVKVPTVKGARVVVAGANGAAYVADPAGGRILKITIEE